MLGSYQVGGDGEEASDSSESEGEKEPKKGKGKKKTNRSESEEVLEEENSKKDRGKSPNQKEWETVTGLVSKPRGKVGKTKSRKLTSIAQPEKVTGGKKWTDPDKLDGWAMEVKKWMEWQDIDLYSEVALELVGFLVGGQATVIYNQYLRNNPIVGDFFGFLLHLRKELVLSNSRDKLWFAWEGSTQMKNGEIRDVNTFSRELNDLQMKIIDSQRNQAISDDVKKFKFYSGLQLQIREKIRPFISWTIDYTEIVQKAEH